MDSFKEDVVFRHGGRAKWVLLKVLSYIFIVVFVVVGIIGLVGIFGANMSWLDFVQLIVGFGLAWALWRNKDNYDLEYEYTFTNNELDFAKVMGQKRRKALMSIRLDSADAIGECTNPAFDRLRSMPDTDLMDLTLNDEPEKRFIYIVLEGRRKLIVMECSDEMWDMMVQSNPKMTKYISKEKM